MSGTVSPQTVTVPDVKRYGPAYWNNTMIIRQDDSPKYPYVGGGTIPPIVEK